MVACRASRRHRKIRTSAPWEEFYFAKKGNSVTDYPSIDFPLFVTTARRRAAIGLFIASLRMSVRHFTPIHARGSETGTLCLGTFCKTFFKAKMG
ncbi:hypothetical protein BaRGS_00008853 [Batillaria attramentaria]|uniref:Uncharacterized protein n=1 Tax=Batillaria attramentaria TaxID=370345 RepID=A0ABD0LKM5_9CAEN